MTRFPSPIDSGSERIGVSGLGRARLINSPVACPDSLLSMITTPGLAPAGRASGTRPDRPAGSTYLRVARCAWCGTPAPPSRGMLDLGLRAAVSRADHGSDRECTGGCSLIIRRAVAAAGVLTLAVGYSVVPGASASPAGVGAPEAQTQVRAWGWNADGQLGDGTKRSRHTPVRTHQSAGMVEVSAGAYFNLAIRPDGTVWGWGDNLRGQLGDGNTTDRRHPVQVPGLDEVTSVSAGGYHGLALKVDGTLWSWGDNAYGQLGTAPPLTGVPQHRWWGSTTWSRSVRPVRAVSRLGRTAPCGRGAPTRTGSSATALRRIGTPRSRSPGSPM